MMNQTLQINGASLNVCSGGQGNFHVLFLHGAMSSQYEYRNITQRLDDTWRWYSMDFRGHGNSEKSKESYTLEQFTNDVIALLEQTIAVPTILVGHSMGALVATLVSAKRPDLVRGIFLEDPPLYTVDSESTSEDVIDAFGETGDWLIAQSKSKISTTDIYNFLRVEAGPRELSGKTLLEVMGDKALNDWAKSYQQVDPLFLKTLLSGGLRMKTNDVLSKVKCKLHIIRGESKFGSFISDAETKQALYLLSDATEHKMVGFGHEIHQLDEDIYYQELQLFRRKLENNPKIITQHE